MQRVSSSRSVKKSKFTPSEDAILKQLVEKYGEHDRESIARKMRPRNSRQCHDRWMFYLSPKVNNMPWTKEEENLLIDLVKEYGGRWTHISKMFNGRTDIQIKNKWNVIKRKLPEEISIKRKPLPSYAKQDIEVCNLENSKKLQNDSLQSKQTEPEVISFNPQLFAHDLGFLDNLLVDDFDFHSEFF